MALRTYPSFPRDWSGFIEKAGFEGMRPYALRHTFATLNLANGENIKAVSVLMGMPASPARSTSTPGAYRTPA